MSKTTEEMIPLELLFSDVELQWLALSPDGTQLAYLAPRDGVLNIWLREARPEACARPLTASRRAIRSFTWAWNGRQLVYRVDPAGNERYQCFALDVRNGGTLALTPEFGAGGHRVSSWGQGFFMNYNSDPSRPDEIMLLTDELEAGRLDVWRVSLAGGGREMVQPGLPGVQRWLVDHSLEVRGYLGGEAGGAVSLRLREGSSGEFNEVVRFAPGDLEAAYPVMFSADGTSLYLLDASGRDTRALVELDLRTLQRRVLAADDEVDVEPGMLVFDPARHVPLAAAFYPICLEWRVLDDAYGALLASFPAAEDEIVYVEPTAHPERALVWRAKSSAPPTVALFDNTSRVMLELGILQPRLAGWRFCDMQPVRFEARDGLPLRGYLTLPHSFEQPGPLVLLVHGGPEARDYRGFDPPVQWLASRGFACLQVNFRGSSGFGKRFQAAGDGQWGLAMQDDLSDAVAWAAAQRIADPGRIAIMGESYGGYAVLAGLTLTPELYAAGIALNAVCDLVEHTRHWHELRPAWSAQTDRRLGRLPRYTEGERTGQLKDEGDWDDADRAAVEALRQRSPLHKVNALRAPLLVGCGAADERVLASGNARFAQACREAGAEIEFIEYEGEGHWLAKPENYVDFYRRAERLLGRCLGGRTQPEAGA